MQEVPHRATANNLIEKRYYNIVAFLDGLSYEATSTPEIVKAREECAKSRRG